MNDQQRAAMQMALGALDHVRFYGTHKFPAAMEALREALAQPQDNLNCKSVQARLATSWGYVKEQPQGEWVDLTDDELLEIAEIDGADDWFFKVMVSVIAKFKEKNTPPSVEAAKEKQNV